MIKLNINGRELTGYHGQTILDIASAGGIDIPTMCYDDHLESYGACGLCVVEIEGSPKLARACATAAADGMVIDTMSEKVIASRKVALELLMSDHVGDCKAPCMLACPGHTDCQGYVGLIANGMMEEAIQTIKDQLPMPACIGRVCPHPCETACRRGLVEESIAIAQLKYFAADHDLKRDDPYMPEIAADSGKSVAIVGGGPGGLSSAYFLRQYGHAVTVYDAMPHMGGMLRYGIPEYRLPKRIVDQEVAIFEAMGIDMKNNMRMGKDFTLASLRETHDAVILATGAWRSSALRCTGHDLPNVVGGIQFLERVNLGERVTIGQRVAVVGGGNTAMDAVRTAVRVGAKDVYNVYRRTKDEMPAEAIEIKEAEEEGVIFKNLVNPTEIKQNDDGSLTVVLQKMTLGEPDASGRRRPVALEGEMETLVVDTVISAIGQKVDPAGHDDVALTDWGTIAADPHSFMTNLDGVFALGDATNDGADIAIAAIGEAKRSGSVIHSYIEGDLKPYYEPFYSINHAVTEENFTHEPRLARAEMPHLAAEVRKTNFEEVNLGWAIETAQREGARCLECGCLDVYECDLIKQSRDYKIKPDDILGEKHYRSQENPHPFIAIDQDKCVLCSQCVRTCDEVLGIGALGLVERGFDSMMSPALDLPLVETGCISCGQCVSVCPTGALQERLTMGVKSIPLPIEHNETVCDKCGLGCHVDINSKAGQIVRIEAVKNSPVDRGQLCVRGRFGHAALGEPLTTPLIKTNGEWLESDWTTALGQIAEQIKATEPSDIAISVANQYCNEDYFALKHWCESMGITTVGSLSAAATPLKSILGVNGSTATFEELNGTNHILLVGCDVMSDYAVLGMQMRKAQKQGVSVDVIDTEQTTVMEWANQHVISDDQGIRQLLAAFIEQRGDDAPAALAAQLTNVTPSAEITELAERYLSAKSAIIVYDAEALSESSVGILAAIAHLSGQLGTPRRGVIELTAGANTRGLRDMGIVQHTDFCVQLNQSPMSTVLSFGDILSSEQLNRASYCVVQAHTYQAWMQSADVILPAQSFAEMNGTITSAEGRLQHLSPALSTTKLSLTRIVNELARITDVTPVFDPQRGIAKTVAGYQVIKTIHPERGEVIRPSVTPADVHLDQVDATQPFKMQRQKSDIRTLLDKELSAKKII